MKAIRALIALFTVLLARHEHSVAQAVSYQDIIKLAEQAYAAKRYDSSAFYYSAAFTMAGRSLPNDRYNAACSWALAGNVDSAFYNLFAIAQLADWRNYTHLMMDADLETLHHYKAWDVLRRQVLANVRKHNPAKDTALANELEDMLVLDQKYRMQLDRLEKTHGRDSEQAKAVWDTIKKYDAQNLSRITQLLDANGWLPRSQIGRSGVTSVFLVLQHADSATQSKYMPMLRNAAQAGELPKYDFALYEDRVLLSKGKKQIYGSQVQCKGDSCYVLPLEDPMQVDARRKSMGMAPLADYVRKWNINWDAAAYLKSQSATKSKPK